MGAHDVPGDQLNPVIKGHGNVPTSAVPAETDNGGQGSDGGVSFGLLKGDPNIETLHAFDFDVISRETLDVGNLSTTSTCL